MYSCKRVSGINARKAMLAVDGLSSKHANARWGNDNNKGVVRLY